MRDPTQRLALQYIGSGGEALRRQLPMMRQSESIRRGVPKEVAGMLPDSAMLDEASWRLVETLARFGQYPELGEWLGSLMLRSTGKEDLQNIAVEAFARAERSTPELVGAVIDRLPLERPDGEPTSAGRWLLTLSGGDLREGVSRMDISGCFGWGKGLGPFVGFLARRSPERLEAVGPAIAEHPDHRIHEEACLALLSATGDRFVEPLLRTWQALEESRCSRPAQSLPFPFSDSIAIHTKLTIGLKLAQASPNGFAEPVRQYVMAVLTDPSYRERLLSSGGNILASIAASVIRYPAPEYVETVIAFLRDPERSEQVLRAMVAEGGAEAAPVLLAALDLPQPPLRLMAAGRLLDLGLEPDSVQRTIRNELSGSACLPGFAELAARRPEIFAESLWKMLGSKSSPAWEAVVRGLSSLGASAVPRALTVLRAEQAVEREAAVRILLPSLDPEVLRALKEHADTEADDSVRDHIILALDGAGDSPTFEQLRKRVDSSPDKIASPPLDWLDLSGYPPLSWKDGSRVDDPMLRFLFYRQSRCEEMCADVEAKAIYAQIDKTTSGDFALSLLNQFVEDSGFADERWVLVVIALLGDDRIVPVLNQQIDEWAQDGHLKMGKYEVQALALLGTDAALGAVSAVSVRYRRQYPGIGQAAVEAFEAAAQAQGISPDELGDRVVPSYRLPRTETIAGKVFELRMDLNGKLSIYNVAARKKVASLPKAAPAELADEVRELKASLKEAWKGQLIRQEVLMLRQMRWPVARWKELYLGRVILFPFAVQLVWGWYDDERSLEGTFRAMEDRTLTTSADQEFRLPESGSVGIIHPLELTAAARGQWTNHLTDHEVLPPFPQLSRQMERVREDQAQDWQLSEVEGATVNALTFRGRAERLGWRRGSVCDGGGIGFYHKPFPFAGAEALVELEGMFIRADVESSVVIRKAFFVRAGSVATGSYVYDEPKTADDPRVLKFGEVPPIAYSETVADLRGIAGVNVLRADQ